MVITLICAIGMATISIAHRYFGVPTWVAIASGWVIPCVGVGMLVGKFRGGLIGAGVGFLLGLLTLSVIWIYGPP